MYFAPRIHWITLLISVMGNLNPHLRDVPDFQHMLWDQLFIISDFNLNVESPYDIPSREELAERPEPLSYPQNFPKYRFYGNNIKRMIDVAISWEDGEKKEGKNEALLRRAIREALLRGSWGATGR